MTIEEARALIPPGWVECDYVAWLTVGGCMPILCSDGVVYLTRKPKPEPRRVPMGEMVITFDQFGWRTGVNKNHDYIRNSVGGYNAVANTKWKLDPDAREWVEVME